VRRLVAEIGAANGDLQYALDAVAAFADAGATHIKGQLYKADTLVTRDAKPYGKGLSEPDTQHQMFTNVLSYDDWTVVKQLCDELGVTFFASVFDLDAVDAGVQQKWGMFKIASGDITYRRLIEYTTQACADTEATLMFSTGASTFDEIMQARRWIADVSPAVLEGSEMLVCTLSYPTRLEDAHVDRIQTWQELIDSNVGYSDHTRGLAAADYAYRLGASIVEKHVTLTPGVGGDHDFAITPGNARSLITGVGSHVVGDALVAGSHEIRVYECEAEARVGARRSLVALEDIPQGDMFTITNVGCLRPGGGIPPADLTEMVGRWAQRFVTAGTQLNDSDVATA